MSDSRGRAVIAGARSREAPVDQSQFAKGFGRELYAQFAPTCFKEAFWTLVDTLGPQFRTIEIYTDDPSFPWELMRPVRPDNTGERDFLGLEFAIGRWHINESGPVLKRPSQSEVFKSIAVIAPHYAGAQQLPGQSDEIKALSKVRGYSHIVGNLASSQALFKSPPQGIVHFAGHGVVHTEGATKEAYAILLEDGEMDLEMWQGIVSLTPQTHPLFFFNACDVGKAQDVLHFVNGWGPAVLRSGASGYIGALWAVDDTVAARFAARYYESFGQALTRGIANPAQILMRTRKSVYEAKGDPTALAYIFYGDSNLGLKLLRPKSLHP